MRNQLIQTFVYEGHQKVILKILFRQETPNSGGGAKGDETSGGDDDDDDIQMRIQRSRCMRAHI